MAHLFKATLKGFGSFLLIFDDQDADSQPVSQRLVRPFKKVSAILLFNAENLGRLSNAESFGGRQEKNCAALRGKRADRRV